MTSEFNNVTEVAEYFAEAFSYELAKSIAEVCGPIANMSVEIVPWNELQNHMQKHPNLYDALSKAIGELALSKWRRDGVPQLAAASLGGMLMDLPTAPEPGEPGGSRSRQQGRQTCAPVGRGGVAGQPACRAAMLLNGGS